MMKSSSAAPAALAILLGLGQAACNPKAPANEDVGAARVDTMAAPKPDTLAATPPITPSSAETPTDTPPTAGAKPTTGGGAKLSKLEYEGWRQYSANCARCHGQDALPNPVAANLLLSLGQGGPITSEQIFADIVTGGRAASGMPAYKSILTPDQIKAIYAYVKGRAEKRIPPGRPASPA